MVIAVDIDGILTVEIIGHNYSKRTANIENINRVNALYNDGYHIILFSSRYEIDRKITLKWLKKHEVTFHELILDKPMYDMLIDDKSYKDFSWMA